MDCSWDFKGYSGIVTGAASGIGAEVSLLLAKSGAALALADRNQSGLAAVNESCGKLSSVEPLPLPVDISKPLDVERMVDETLQRYGKIDFLVTSAGVLYRSQFLDIELAEWDEVMASNVRGMFLCNQAVVKAMLKNGGGRIVNIASVAGRSISLIGGAHYATSKHAVVGLTRHMARELCKSGIRANVFCPGATHTPMIHDNLNAEQVEELEQRIALGRLASPDEQARVVAYLLSDAASYLNGACVDSNGGSVML